MKIPALKGATRLVVMPDDGVQSVKQLIDGATRSLTIKMFEFDCPVVAGALVDARARGVEVAVLLNPVRSNGSRPNDGTMAMLRNAGVEAGWTSPRFKITHEKSMIVDARAVLISTFNYSPKYFTKTRDYGVLVEDPGVAEEVAAGFAADRAGEPHALREGSPLAWGNQDARRVVAGFVDAAKHTLCIQHPKFHDAAILDRVMEARQRGVEVRLLCGGTHGIESYNLQETLACQRILARAGVVVRRQHGLKLHAKLLLADGKRAMVGSMNIDRDAYDVRRELGIVLDGTGIVKALQRRFDTDWQAARHYEPSDPLEAPAPAVGAPGADDIVHD